MAGLALKPTHRRRLEPTGWFGLKTREVQETGYTWVVDGEDLSDWIRHRNSDPELAMPAGETVWLPENVEDARQRRDRLDGHLPSDYEGGRVALLSCEICGDPGCGTLSAELVVSDAIVQWRDLGWTSGNPDDPVLFFSPTLTLIFDRAHYHHVLGDARDGLGHHQAPTA